MIFTAKRVGFIRGYLPAAICFVTLFACNVLAFKVTVDSTKASGEGNYRFLDSLIIAMDNPGNTTLNSNPGVIDTVLFTDTTARVYRMTVSPMTDTGSIIFMSLQSNPDKFPVIKNAIDSTNPNSQPWWNYFQNMNVTFERLTFTGLNRLTSSNNAKEYTFRNCVIRGYPSTVQSFFTVNGQGGSKTVFENCLVVDNEFSVGFLDIETYGTTASTIQVINCTIDNNAKVFYAKAGVLVSLTTIKNCVFSANDNTYSGTPLLKPQITSSIVPDSTFGTGCKVTSNPYYVKQSGKTVTSDWRLSDSSMGRALGDTAGAPATDITGTLRVDSNGRRDAGCFDILDPVVITSQPKGDTVTAGDEFIMKVTANGAPPLNYQWYRIGGGANPVSTADSFKIFSATASDDSARYYCSVTNPVSTKNSDTITLRVFQKPAITDQPDTTIVFNGDSAMFSITASGGGLAYTWKRNGTVIEGASSPNYTLRNVSVADSGAIFVCVVKNMLDSAVSQAALLRVVPFTAEIIQKTNDTTLMEGASLNLKVIASGKPPFTYAWYKTGNPALLSSTDTYSKTNVNLADGGVYRCFVSNGSGDDTAIINIVITKGQKPVITGQSGPVVIAKAGTDVSLNVTVSGEEPFVYAWYKGDFASCEKVASGMTYTIASAGESDGGKFFCIVNNDNGIDTSNIITLTVSSSPFFNPLSLSCSFVNRTSVKVSISGFRNLPSAPGASPHVDTIGLWYDELTMPSGTLSSSDSNVVKLPLARMLPVTGDRYDTIVNLPEYGNECYGMHFITVPLWKNPDSIISTVSSAQQAKIYMCDTTILENKLVLELVYAQLSDSITVKISNLVSINRDSLKTLKIGYTFGSGGRNETVIARADVPPGDNFIRVFHDGRFAEGEDTLTVSVAWQGILGNSSSDILKKIVVGKPRPANNARLFLDSTTSSVAYIHWQFDGAKDFDSIRIIWGTQPITATTTAGSSGFQSMMIGPSVTAVSIPKLIASRQYYIGLQVMKSSITSLISANAMVTCLTKAPIVVVNSIKLYEASFQKETNSIKLSWSIDTVQSGSANSLETGIAWSINTPLDIMAAMGTGNIRTVTDCNADNSLIIDIGDSIRFSSTYYFGLILRKKDGDTWSLQTEFSQDTVQIGKPSWQKVTYFNVNTAQVTAFNDVAIIKKAGAGVVNVEDTLIAFMPDAIDAGFKIVSDVGIDFKHDRKSDPVTIGLMYNTALVGNSSVNTIRMYQFDNEKHTWHILDGFTIDSLEKRVYVEVRPNDYPRPFILLIDTLPPQIEVMSNTDSSVVSGKDITDTIRISDNIANSQLKLVFWGSNGNGGNSTAAQRCTSNVCIMHTVIPKDSFSVDRSIKSELVISDGVNKVVIDNSRVVDRPVSYQMALPAMEWTPVMATANLVNKSAEAAFLGLCKEGKWKYDATEFRVFRWVDTSLVSEFNNMKDSSNWIEYNSGNSKFFEMVPGRVVWAKTRNKRSFSMGKGATVSMKDPCGITLKPKSWNDIALPYKIDIRLYDIFAASGNGIYDSIQIYKWVKDTLGTSIAPSPVYLPVTPGYDSAGTILTSSAGENMVASYTICNNMPHEVTLKIPAIPVSFSNYIPASANGGTAKRKKTNKSWSIKVEARTETGRMPPVICAFNEGTGMRTAALPPAFGSQRIMLSGGNRNKFFGSIVQVDANKNGFDFPVLFENRADTSAQFSYTVTTVADLPKQWYSMLYDPATGKSEPVNGNHSLTVQAAAGTYKILLVGDSSYVASRSGIFGATLSALRMYPNPCRGTMSIRFMLPFVDVKSVDVCIFDQLGRRAWNKTFSGRSLAMGENTILWQPGAHNRLSAGTYIVQVSAVATSGQKLGMHRQRILYFP